MANRPVETAEPYVTVDPGLPAGRHRFRLVVENDRGERSRPAEAIVEVRGSNRVIEWLRRLWASIYTRRR